MLNYTKGIHNKFIMIINKVGYIGSLLKFQPTVIYSDMVYLMPSTCMNCYMYNIPAICVFILWWNVNIIIYNCIFTQHDGYLVSFVVKCYMC